MKLRNKLSQVWVGGMEVFIMDLWEHYRWICSAPEWSTTDGYAVLQSGALQICSPPHWSATDLKITHSVAVCTAPGWSTTDSKIPQYFSTNYRPKDGHPTPYEVHPPSPRRSHAIPRRIIHSPLSRTNSPKTDSNRYQF